MPPKLNEENEIKGPYKIVNKYRQLVPSPKHKPKDARIEGHIGSSEKIVFFFNSKKTLGR